MAVLDPIANVCVGFCDVNHLVWQRF